MEKLGAFVLTLVLGLSVATVGCPNVGADPQTASALQWSPCPGQDGVECADLMVPLDPSAPQKGQIPLALARRPATDPSARIGSLVIEPGGPGLSGVEEVFAGHELATPEVAARYDIVGFDPRGVGRSDPLWCFTQDQMDRYLNQQAAAGWETDPSAPEVVAFAQTAASFGQGCAAANAQLLPYLGTRNVAADLDRIRAALGEDKLDYLGWSYGTKLGAIYADMFPDRVGRMVLDSAIDPSLNIVQFNKGQSEALEAALRRFFDYCATVADCPLPAGQQAATTALKDFMLRLPASRETPEALTRSDVLSALTTAMYIPEEYFPQLVPALADGMKGDAKALREIAGNYGEQSPDEPSNFLNALYAVNCVDSPPTPDVAGTALMAAEWNQSAPIFGPPNAWGNLRCNTFPAHSAIGPQPVSAAGAPPIVIVGSLRDAATPIEWSRQLASQLKSSVLIEVDHDVHAVYPVGPECVNGTVDRFLLTGEAPQANAVCSW